MTLSVLSIARFGLATTLARFAVRLCPSPFLGRFTEETIDLLSQDEDDDYEGDYGYRSHREENYSRLFDGVHERLN